MLKCALAIAGLTFSDEDRKAVLQGVNRSLNGFEEVRKLEIPNDVSPPFYFSAIVPGMKVNRTREPLHFSAPVVKRPANLEDVAFWPVVQLAQLIKTRQVTSLELTQMYLARLHKYNGKLNCVVTFLDDLAIAQAKQADAEIAAGKYKGPLHGIPWGAKDIIAVKGYKTTWGSGAYKEQMIHEDASVVEMLRDAGAVLLAKLTSGELAQGDNWFGGQTKNPWNTEQGSSGSSAGPGSATAGGCVAFAIGTETSGSILSPSGPLRRHRPASDVRPHQPAWRDGAFLDAGSAGPDVPLRRGLRDGDERDRQAGWQGLERLRNSVQLECAPGYSQAARGLSERRFR